MGMALKSELVEAFTMSGTAKPLDLVHLSRQTMGDQALERDVLSIFVSQTKVYLEHLQAVRAEEERKQYAHRLKGAARGIGAWELARIAEEAEKPGFNDYKSVESEIHSVCDYIRVLGEK